MTADRIWLVDCRDDYWENGDQGVTEFDTCQQALDFIERRIREGRDDLGNGGRDLRNYTLYEAVKFGLEAVSHVEKIRAVKAD